MPTYHYKGSDRQGKKQSGYLEAESQARAFQMLQRKGVSVFKLDPIKDKPSSQGLAQVLQGKLPIGKLQLGESFYYLGLMLQSGLSLTQALRFMGRMATGRRSRIWLDLCDHVESGEAFSAALQRYPKQFPQMYVGMIQVAEQAGKLGRILEDVASHEEQREEVRGQLLNAMIYPAVILVVGIGAIYFLLSRVLPRITSIFTNSGQQLEFKTRLLIDIGETLQAWGPAGPLTLLLPVLLVIIAYRHLEQFRRLCDKLAWKVPIFQQQILARFSGMLGFQLQAGIPLVQALESASRSVGSIFFQEHIQAAAAEVSAGQPLDRVLEKQNIFPEIYILTVATGQKSGQLGAFLQRFTIILERRVDNMLKRFVSFVEPMLILLVGLVIGFIVMAIMGPIFELSTLVE